MYEILVDLFQVLGICLIVVGADNLVRGNLSVRNTEISLGYIATGGCILTVYYLFLF